MPLDELSPINPDFEDVVNYFAQDSQDYKNAGDFENVENPSVTLFDLQARIKSIHRVM
jgi:hypothetical protein